MFESRNFSDAHIFFQYEDNIIMGLNRRNELSAFGGRNDYNETLMATLVREYVEESHESIVSVTCLVDLLKEKSKYFIDRRKDGRLSFSVLIRLKSFNYYNAATTFHKYVTCESKAHCEILDLVVVPIKDILSFLNKERPQTLSHNIRVPAIKSLQALLR